MKLVVVLSLFFSFVLPQSQEFEVVGYECGDCHGSSGWTVLTLQGFDHDVTGFPLKDTHKMQPCSACHPGSTVQEKHNFSTTNGSCITCHMDVHQSELGSDCEQCHNNRSWQVTRQSFDHEMTRFSILGAHNSVACEDCHTEKPMVQFKNTSMACFHCHETDYASVVTPSHMLAQMDHDCQSCHPATRKRWNPSTFVHQEFYELTGTHETIDCYNCHEGVFRGTANDCRTCHTTEFDATGTAIYPEAPRHGDSDFFAEQCEECHSTTTWLPVDFDHAITGYILEGKHVEPTCNQCHGDAGYDLPDNCQGCHQPGGLATTTILDGDYDHTLHSLPSDCELCHTVRGWDESLFDHDNFSENLCIDCHLLEQTEASNPPHENDNISTDCVLCHEAGEEWSIPAFDHSETQTGYSLLGLHLLVDCTECHNNDVYNTTPNNCQDNQCHVSHYNSTTDPDHNIYGYPIGYCEICHNPLGWIPSLFSHTVSDVCATCHLPDFNSAIDPVHDVEKGYTHTCENCHTSTSSWDGALMDHTGLTNCVDCHLSDYLGTTNPDHEEKGYSTNCMQCHQSTDDWLQVEVDHSNYTDPCATCHLSNYNEAVSPNHVDNQFPTVCDNCHVGTTVWRIENYAHSVSEIECIVCHQPAYDGVTEPNHVDNQFDADCLLCHESTDSWVITNYNHSFTEIICSVCHMPDYNATTDPNHAEKMYPLDCTLCHQGTSNWDDADFEHVGVTGDQCWDCHAGDYYSVTDPNHETNNYSHDCTTCHQDQEQWTNVIFNHDGITGDQCWDCHAGDYEGVADPNHAANNYDHNCFTCHNSTVNWNDVTFSHDNITQPCVDCHLSDYLGVSNPNHNAQGYPQDCSLCHYTTDWEDEFFNHAFPIFAGEHDGEWSTCIAECHIYPENFEQFTCGLNGICHEHRQSKMNEEHDDVNDYSYESSACYECHPTGEEDEGGDGDGDRRRPPKEKHDWKNILKNN